MEDGVKKNIINLLKQLLNFEMIGKKYKNIFQVELVHKQEVMLKNFYWNLEILNFLNKIILILI